MKSEILREEVVFLAVLWAQASRSRGVKYHRYACAHGVDISRGDGAVVVDTYSKPIVLRVVVDRGYLTESPQRDRCESDRVTGPAAIPYCRTELSPRS